MVQLLFWQAGERPSVELRQALVGCFEMESSQLSKPRFFVARLVNDDPYRVYGTRKHIAPEPDDARCIWRGDNANVAIQIMKEANEERRKQKQAERSQRAARIRHLRKLEEERWKKFAWESGAPKDGGTIFG